MSVSVLPLKELQTSLYITHEGWGCVFGSWDGEQIWLDGFDNFTDAYLFALHHTGQDPCPTLPDIRRQHFWTVTIKHPDTDPLPAAQLTLI